MESITSNKKGLNRDLLQFYDEFVAFHDHCSFLCDACAGLAHECEGMDESTAMGLKRYCHWMKERMEDLKRDLQVIRATEAH